MTAFPRSFDIGTPVTHSRHGTGRVVAHMGTTVVVRFGEGLQQVLADELHETASLALAIDEKVFSEPSDAVLRAQALCVASINDQWGVFSRSRVQLLPHQLGFAARSIGNGPSGGSSQTTWGWERPSSAAYC